MMCTARWEKTRTTKRPPVIPAGASPITTSIRGGYGTFEPEVFSLRKSDESVVFTYVSTSAPPADGRSQSTGSCTRFSAPFSTPL